MGCEAEVELEMTYIIWFEHPRKLGEKKEKGKNSDILMTLN